MTCTNVMTQKHTLIRKRLLLLFVVEIENGKRVTWYFSNHLERNKVENRVREA